MVELESGCDHLDSNFIIPFIPSQITSHDQTSVSCWIFIYLKKSLSLNDQTLFPESPNVSIPLNGREKLLYCLIEPFAIPPSHFNFSFGMVIKSWLCALSLLEL